MENVWDSQSVLSAMDDLYELVLIRWDQKDEWSPWNCVLLTKEEASAHAKLENVNEVKTLRNYLILRSCCRGWIYSEAHEHSPSLPKKSTHEIFIC